MTALCDELRVRPLRGDERGWLEELLEQTWGLPLVSRGRVYDAASLPALACAAGGELVGAATYAVEGAACELVTLNAARREAGVGTALLGAVADVARHEGCGRLWLVTTNDNLRALRFYQRRGMRLVAVHAGAIDAARRIKPSIPLAGEHGIPLRDELELELEL